MGMGNLAHFMHKIALFHQQQGGSNQSRGAQPPDPLTLTTGQQQGSRCQIRVPGLRGATRLLVLGLSTLVGL